MYLLWTREQISTDNSLNLRFELFLISLRIYLMMYSLYYYFNLLPMLTFLVDLERLNLRLIFLQKIKFALWIQSRLVKLLHVLFISSD